MAEAIPLPDETPSEPSAPAGPPAAASAPEPDLAAFADPDHLASMTPWREGLSPSLEPLRNLGYDDKQLLRVVDRAKQHGIAPEQFAALARDFAEIGIDSLPPPVDPDAVAERHRESAEDALRSKFGDQFTERVGDARRAAITVLGDDHQELVNLRLEGGGLLGNHRAFVEALAGASARLQATTAPAAAPATVLPMSVLEAEQALDLTLREDMAILQDPLDPAREHVLARRNTLAALAFGTANALEKLNVGVGPGGLPSGGGDEFAISREEQQGLANLSPDDRKTFGEMRVAAEAAQSSVDRLWATQSNALMDGQDPEHRAAVEELTRLQGIRFAFEDMREGLRP